MIFLGIIFEVVLLLCLTYVPVLQDVFGTVPLILVPKFRKL